MRQVFWEDIFKNNGWRQTRLGWEGNFRQGVSVKEGTRERAGETDVCSWSQINEAKLKEEEQSSFRRLSILPLQAWNAWKERECAGADAGRIAVAKTNSKLSTFKKDIITVLNWELRLEISISLCWGLTTFSNYFYRFLCTKSAVFSCLLETTCTLEFFECRLWRPRLKEVLYCLLSFSVPLFLLLTQISLLFFPPLPYLWRQYFQMCTFSVLSECSLD